MDPVAFAVARLAEEEAGAQAASPCDWYPTGEDVLARSADPHWDGVVVANAEGAYAEHIARHDPARTLREADADRRLLARYEQLRKPRTLRERVIFPMLAEVVLACIRDRVAVWSDHPDYATLEDV